MDTNARSPHDDREIDDRELANVSAGRRGQDGTDLLIWNNGDGSDLASRESLEAAGLEVVVAAASL